MARKPIVAGNWKMNNTNSEAVALTEAIKKSEFSFKGVEVVLCPPFTALKDVGALLAGSSIRLGAQNMHWEKSGAFTGEISAGMLRELFCHYVIIGHSERRQYFCETDETVNKKVLAAIAANLHPIVCVGETLEQRKANETKNVIEKQVRGAFKNVSKEAFMKVVIAYEPVWAIGTGVNATPEQAQEVHAFIRALIGSIYDEKTAQAVRIQYGGSVKPANAKAIFSQPDVDGGLIGGASLEADSFIAIISAAQ